MCNAFRLFSFSLCLLHLGQRLGKGRICRSERREGERDGGEKVPIWLLSSSSLLFLRIAESERGKGRRRKRRRKVPIIIRLLLFLLYSSFSYSQGSFCFCFYLPLFVDFVFFLPISIQRTLLVVQSTGDFRSCFSSGPARGCCLTLPNVNNQSHLGNPFLKDPPVIRRRFIDIALSSSSTRRHRPLT